MSETESSPEVAEREAVQKLPQNTEEKGAAKWTPEPRRPRQGGEAIGSAYTGDDDAGDCGLAA